MTKVIALFIELRIRRISVIRLAEITKKGQNSLLPKIKPFSKAYLANMMKTRFLLAEFPIA